MMGHMAGIRTGACRRRAYPPGERGCDVAPDAPRVGAWSRRAILRAHGWWEAGADRLLSAYYGWANRTSRLALAEPAGEVRNGSCAAPLESGEAEREREQLWGESRHGKSRRERAARGRACP